MSYPQDQNSNRDFDSEAIVRRVEQDLVRHGLNGEVLITMMKEFDRITKGATHKQIHVLANLVESLEYTLALRHAQIVSLEGEEGHE